MADINSELNRFNGTSNDALMLRNSLEGSTDPSTATKGFVGQIYVNSSTGDTFVCKSASTENYVWIELGNKLFDIIIRTQAEFEALIVSPTWLDAKSVCFVGDGGTLKFTRSDGLGCKIPQTVKNIQGLIGAIIEVTNFVYNDTSNKAALWYQTSPTTNDYWVDGLTINCTGTSTGYTYGFRNCIQLTNCTGTSTGGDYGAYGFRDCIQLINCTGIGNGNAAGYGFRDCIQLTNCTGSGTSTHISSGFGAYGFNNCTKLINCTGSGTGNTNTYGFGVCIQLTNCTGIGTGNSTSFDSYGFCDCIQLTNCTGSGTGNSTGYGFYECSYLSNCKQGTASTTSFLGGANTHVCTETVAAT